MRKAKQFGLSGLPVLFFKERTMFIAYSPALDLSASGKTMREAKKNFTEVLDVFLEELMEHGTLEQVLTDMGWSKAKKAWQSPVEIRRSVVIPFKLPVAA